MKRELARKINFTVWFFIAIALIGTVYGKWSARGVYTLGSFLVSLLIHGGPCVFFAFVFDEWINDYYDRREGKNGKKQ